MVFGRMVQQTDKGWLTVLEKNGLRLAADIFENYGIDSETDLSVFDQDDFTKLPSPGLKPLHVKKLVTSAVSESVSENEIEHDGEEDDDDSDNDLQIVGEQSCTSDSTGASSAGTEAPAKKVKITLTEEQERFAKQFHPAARWMCRVSHHPTH